MFLTFDYKITDSTNVSINLSVLENLYFYPIHIKCMLVEIDLDTSSVDENIKVVRV